MKLSTRGPKTAEAIRDRIDFTTHGALSAHNPRGRYIGAGRLTGLDLDQFYIDQDDIDYVVLSYSTPIAWHTPEGGWYKVKQKFSPTSSNHQGTLYLATSAVSHG